MNDMTPPPAGHNNPPCPIELVIAEYDGEITEAQNWADGEPVTDEASMKVVDAVLKGFKSYKSALVNAGKERTTPFHKAWRAEVAAVKVYTDDADLMQKALVDIVAPFKAKLAEEAKEAERKAWEETNRLRREADAQVAQARAGDIEAQRAANEAKQAAMDAEKAAKKAVADAPKGMRTVTKYEITSHKALLHFIASKHKDDLTAFIEEWARKNHKSIPADGLRVWQDKEAF